MALQTYEQALKKKFICDQLLRLGIEQVNGQPIDQLDYKTLKYCLAAEKCSSINIESDQNVWF